MLRHVLLHKQSQYDVELTKILLLISKPTPFSHLPPHSQPLPSPIQILHHTPAR